MDLVQMQGISIKGCGGTIHQVDIGRGKVVRNEGVREWRELTDGHTVNKIMDEIRR